MKNRKVGKSCFRWSAIGLASAMLFGCGGGTESGGGSAEQPQSVQVTETATVLSVKTELPAGSSTVSSEMQSLLFAFAAKVDAGPNAGLTLKGTLVLKGESGDDGPTEVEGRLLPEPIAVIAPAPAASAASAPSSASLKAAFDAQRKTLKDTLRADIDVLSATLKRDLAAVAVPGATAPSAAQKEVLATFKALFDQRMLAYRAALGALTAEYATLKDGAPKPSPEKAAKGYEVHGTIDAQGAIKLTLSLGDSGKVLVKGLMAADGSAKGTLTGPTSTDQGTWTAAGAVGSPPPPPAPPAPPPPTPAPPPPPPAPLVGDVALGTTVYANCAGCHGADPASKVLNIQKGVTASALAAAYGNVGSMNRFTTSLTATDNLNLAAYIKSRVAP